MGPFATLVSGVGVGSDSSVEAVSPVGCPAGTASVADTSAAAVDVDWGKVVAVADPGASEGSLAQAIRSMAEAARSRGRVTSLFGWPMIFNQF